MKRSDIPSHLSSIGSLGAEAADHQLRLLGVEFDQNVDGATPQALSDDLTYAMPQKIFTGDAVTCIADIQYELDQRNLFYRLTGKEAISEAAVIAEIVQNSDKMTDIQRLSLAEAAALVYADLVDAEEMADIDPDNTANSYSVARNQILTSQQKLLNNLHTWVPFTSADPNCDYAENEITARENDRLESEVVDLDRSHDATLVRQFGDMTFEELFQSVRDAFDDAKLDDYAISTMRTPENTFDHEALYLDLRTYAALKILLFTYKIPLSYLINDCRVIPDLSKPA